MQRKGKKMKENNFHDEKKWETITNTRMKGVKRKEEKVQGMEHEINEEKKEGSTSKKKGRQK